ncbi:hypothetical protein [Mesorhizobium sp. B1-1-8]|uniref:hypothetical protein n=1 Tax=Mesorhizobium sp. B1-1-8 TaxID=2589976 RepID=UPI00112EAFFF|nr:hypothetical protein [Mesorhizobium sp. B1-1-8]UCI06018.1 hypothetical protein FJ974_19590 [Mesorhizobium sp. B1-1-8]
MQMMAVKDWSCALSEDIGRVVLMINPAEGEPVLAMMTLFQAAKMGLELQSPELVTLSGSSAARRWGRS